jgi:hypothetical protein
MIRFDQLKSAVNKSLARGRKKLPTHTGFRRALRRNPAWAMAMAEASNSNRARAHEGVRRNRAGVMAIGQVPGRTQLRRALRRNRAGVIALVAVGALVALLNGIGAAHHTFWFPMTPPAIPPARFGQGSAYDLVTSDLIIFGGASSSSFQNGVIFNDTWTWSGENWREQRPPTKPPGRGLHSMA